MDTVNKYTYIVVKWLFNHYYNATYGRKELILKELRDLNEATKQTNNDLSQAIEDAQSIKDYSDNAVKSVSAK